ncbi:MFS general substrate transporter [Yamadazyma tenuis ATCC 10573]|uniref:MFS general substrate transporter n=2 Tax=Candida tenuis TaxID=2315449 RepID=G3B2Z9_CANTC|nr:MFS general substrate transporter [Yamadazyma tenuis ATCC 10573]EGV64046.1 MFS general substrate transporter [Yamadazyma tenuis ATCC 10573]
MNSEVDPAESARVARKIDWHMLPILCILYGINYVDKAALGWAVLFTFKQDLGLVGTDYSWVSSIFYFGYLGAQYPASYCLQRFPAGKVIACTTVGWGAIMLGHIGCKNYAGILVCRFLLGVFEAPISGGFVLFCSLFYTRKEQVGRTMVWGSMQGIFNVIFGFVSYGLGHAHNSSLKEWQLIYLVLGLCSFVIGGLWFAFIPDTPGKARFLTEDEKVIAIKRVSKNMMGTATHDWKWSQTLECLMDPKTWLMVAFILFSMIPNGGLTNFGSLVLADIVHNNLESIAVGVGSSFFSAGQMLIFSIFAIKYNNFRTIGMTFPMLLAIAGLSAVYATETHGAKWGRVFAYWMINSYAVTWPFTLSMLGSNYAGHTKRASMSMILLIFFAVGNIIGPFCFTSADAPKYTKALATNLGCFCACFVIGVGLRVYLMYANKVRDKKYGVVDAEINEDKRLEGILNGMKDETDIKNKSFRYVL